MAKVCDNKSVGIIVWKDGKLLMIERKKYNPGLAIPAGHQDGMETLPTAAKELEEEVGIMADKLEEKLFERLDNTCKREGGSFHEWTIFEAVEWHGEIKPSEEETNKVFWADREMIKGFVKRLEEWAGFHKIALRKEYLPELAKLTNTDELWKNNLGLEPPMYFLFKKLGII